LIRGKTIATRRRRRRRRRGGDDDADDDIARDSTFVWYETMRTIRGVYNRLN
jgi:hypothetical protein